MMRSRGYCVLVWVIMRRGRENGRGVNCVYFLPQTRSRSMKNVAVLNSPGGSRQRRLPRLVKCRRFPTVCSRKYTQLTPLTLSLPLTIPKLTPDGIASLTWVCKNFEVSLHPTHPARSPPMSLRHREGRQRKRRAGG